MKNPISCLIATSTIFSTLAGVSSIAGLGISTGLILNHFLNFQGRDYSIYNIEDYEDNVESIISKYKRTSKSAYLSTFKVNELANIATYNVTQHKYAKSIGLGSVKASLVTQDIHSFYQKSDDSYFFENISSGVTGVYKRFYQTGENIKMYLGDGLTSSTANWNKEAAIDSDLESFEEDWGRNLTRYSIFIVSSKTIIAEESSAKKVGDEIHLSIELDPITSVLRYVKQMNKTSDLDAPPKFHKMHIDMVLDENLNLLKSKTDEVYDVKSFGITAKGSKGILEETLIYDVEEPVPGLDEDCDYTIGG